MDSLPQLAFYLAKYGYLAIFLLVFLQQIGIPNPVTNELVLLFCGYLSYTGTLNIYEAIIVKVLADFIGSSILFFVFYSFSKWLIEHSPKWLPLSGERIEKLKKSLLKRGHYTMFIGRMTPFIRGYVSVIAGMLNINRKAFIGTVIVSAIVWNAGLVLLGRLAGPYWSIMMKERGAIQIIILLVVAILIIMYIGRYFLKRQLKENK